MRLQQAGGGHQVHVHLGPSTVPSNPKGQVSCKDVLTMAASAHLTGKQTDSVLADMRAVLCRNIIEPVVKDARILNNSQYKEFFSSEKAQFWNTDVELVVKPFF